MTWTSQQLQERLQQQPGLKANVVLSLPEKPADRPAALPPPPTPSATPAAPVRPAKRKKRSGTNRLTAAVVQLLQLRGFHVWRQNNAAVYDASFGGYRAGSSTPGIPDIIGFHLVTGRFAGVEIKFGKDTLSDEQTDFLEAVRAAGGFACCGRSVEQVDQEVQQYLLQLPTT